MSQQSPLGDYYFATLFPEAEFMNVNFVEVSGHNLESSQA
jgi:hypothetical protein